MDVGPPEVALGPRPPLIAGSLPSLVFETGPATSRRLMSSRARSGPKTEGHVIPATPTIISAQVEGAGADSGGRGQWTVLPFFERVCNIGLTGWLSGGEAFMSFLSTRRRVLEYPAFGFIAATFKVYAPGGAAATEGPELPSRRLFFRTRIARLSVLVPTARI
jgi:hypothetical protein